MWPFSEHHRLPLRANGRRHGWHPDLPDHRDHKFTRRAVSLASVDLRTSPFQPPIYDQGQLGSCVANGCARCYEFDQKKQGQADFTPSRLQLYYDGRLIEHTVNQDSGLQIRDGIKALAQYGVAHENLWPYVISKYRTAPPKIAVLDAANHKAITYERVDNSQPSNIMHALGLGFPVVFGATLYQSFESNAVAANGMVPMPSPSETPIGGHCMTIVGFTPSNWIVANSWGVGWGDRGYAYFPIPYLTNLNLASDFWVLESVSKQN